MTDTLHNDQHNPEKTRYQNWLAKLTPSCGLE